MNKENIHQLEAGRELDRLVAEKVLGWRCDLAPYLKKGVQWCWIDADNNVIDFAGVKGDDATENDVLPKFSTDIADTQIVVEYLGYKYQWVNVCFRPDNVERYECKVDYSYDGLATHVVYADTASLAICRCALFIVELINYE